MSIKISGQARFGTTKSFLTENGEALAVIHQLTPKRNGLQHIDSSVVAALQDRLLCRVQSTVVEVVHVCLSNIVEKCSCVDVHCPLGFLYVVRSPEGPSPLQSPR